MRYSVTMVATDRGLGIADVARAVEERGLDGIWLPDHTHIPVTRQTPYPLGGELPERYRRTLDPLAALAMAAAVTSRIRVGTGVLLAAQRDPIVTAKALATIDDQSGGRLAVGVGYGWNVEEMRDHGVDPATRRARLREHVLAMRRLWEDEEAAFDGKHVRFAPSWSWPKPAQRPLPVLVGGAATATVFAHIAEFGQGWVPTGGRPLADGVPRLREAVAESGRDPGDLEVIPFLTAAQADHRRIDALAQAGATELAFDLQPGDGTTVRGELDRLAELTPTAVVTSGRRSRSVPPEVPDGFSDQQFRDFADGAGRVVAALVGEHEVLGGHPQSSVERPGRTLDEDPEDGVEADSEQAGAKAVFPGAEHRRDLQASCLRGPRRIRPEHAPADHGRDVRWSPRSDQPQEGGSFRGHGRSQRGGRQSRLPQPAQGRGTQPRRERVLPPGRAQETPHPCPRPLPARSARSWTRSARRPDSRGSQSSR